MKQLKFDKNGFILPQKITYDIKHEATTKEAIREIELERDLLRGLEILAPEDRNIKALTIWSNPNYKYGPDHLIQKKIEKILKKLIDKKIVLQEKSQNGLDIFLLIKLKNLQKN
ncbi:MAG: hypothetical protein ACFFDF_19225 [Candidatus Odinarchaeota archaeon]